MLASSEREQRYRTQIFAALLLSLFMAQAAYFATRAPLTGLEMQFAQAGMQDSPLTARIAHTLFRPGFEWIMRVPFILFGAMLGASLWYVARRLYGNAGGFVALALYAFSPSMISSSAVVRPETAAAWGMFGCIFTGIAVGHTLYAPREVVLWNWKRIVLLAVAIALGVGSQFAVVLAIPMALAFMLYLVPERRGAALTIVAAAAVMGAALLMLLYGFHFGALAMAARPLGMISLSMIKSRVTWYMVLVFLLRNGPGFVLLTATALATYAVWRRTRFFGTAAPLLSAAALILLGLLLPYAAGFSFLVLALPFVFLFVAGIMADLLQTRQAHLIAALILASLAIHAYFSLSGLWRL